MNKKILPLLLTVLVLISGTVFGQGIPWSGIISVDSVQATPGSVARVKVRLSNNDLSLSGLEVPLKFNSTYLTLDSVSFVGAMNPSTIAAVYFQKNQQSVKISYYPDAFVSPLPVMAASTGVLGELFFTVSNSATPGYIVIDSINKDSVVGNGIHIMTRVNVSDTLGANTYLPQFDPGGVAVLVPTAIDDDPRNSLLPSEFALDQNYPNPFNPTTNIEFSLPTAGHVKLNIFNVLGQNIATVTDRQYSAGNHQVSFDGDGFPSGIYFYRLAYDGKSQTRKMVLMK